MGLAVFGLGDQMRVALIAKPGHAESGGGRYALELERALRSLGYDVLLVNPVIPFPGCFMHIVRRWPGWDLEAFFNNYPLWARYPKADIYHLTSQNLATLMFFRRPPGKVVVTVHDLIPSVTKDDPELRIYQHRFDELFDRISLWGIQKTEAIITVSDHSAIALKEHLAPLARIIQTIPLGTQ